jgi:hypothetical protein
MHHRIRVDIDPAYRARLRERAARYGFATLPTKTAAGDPGDIRRRE